jgi:hypothetical protein
MADIVKIKAWIPDPQALQQVLSSANVQVECGSPKQDNSGNYIITLYAPKHEADKLHGLPFRLEMDEHYGDVLEQRRNEVSQTDRFQGGKIKPTGLGTKK